MKDHVAELIEEFDYLSKQHWAYFTDTDAYRVTTCVLKIRCAVGEFKHHPEEFDFDAMSNIQKTLLLQTSYTFFSKLIDISKIDNKLLIALFLNFASVRKYIKWDKVTKKDYSLLAEYRPEYFAKYSLPLNNLNANAWEQLLKHDSAYCNEFLDNIAIIRNKTELRRIVHKSSVVAQNLTIEHIESSVLSVKEWLLFFNRKSVKKSGIKLSKTVREWMDMQFHVDVLSGSANNTIYTVKARNENGKI